MSRRYSAGTTLGRRPRRQRITSAETAKKEPKVTFINNINNMDIGSDVDLTDINVTKFSGPLSRETEDWRVEDTRNST